MAGREAETLRISDDELNEGMIFILQLRNVAGGALQWIEILRGDIARRWYAIYQSSDWDALRMEAGGVFRNVVSQAQVDDVLEIVGRCVFINTPLVKLEELRERPAFVPPREEK
jgi:hypothetical protein